MIKFKIKLVGVVDNLNTPRLTHWLMEVVTLHLVLLLVLQLVLVSYSYTVTVTVTHWHYAATHTTINRIW